MKATVEAVEEAVGGFSFSSEFVLFILDSRMHYHLNLDLAYYLSHAQSIHLRGAARLLDTTRRALLDQVLASNPAFERRTILSLRGDEGGHRRDILLSEKARGLIEEIQALALLRRGGDRCQELRAEAEKARKERIKMEESKKSSSKKCIVCGILVAQRIVYCPICLSTKFGPTKAVIKDITRPATQEEIDKMDIKQ